MPKRRPTTIALRQIHIFSIFLILSSFILSTLDGLAPYARFYAAGMFDCEIATGNETSIAQNVAFFANNEWHTLGNQSPNGEVFTITTDLCRNVYIGGNFSHIGSTYTGPVAKYSFRQQRWMRIGENETPLNFTSGSYVKSVTTVCQTYISDAECSCNVYIGGKFEILGTAPQRAINVAKWNDERGLWDPIVGIFAPIIVNGTEIAQPAGYSHEVRTVFRRTRMDSFPYCTLVYVGGDFPGYFKIYAETMVDSFSDGTWSDPADKGLINGPINSLFAIRADWPEDPTEVGMVGEFSFETTNHLGEEIYCKSICKYQVDNDKLLSFGVGSDYELPPFGGIQSNFFSSNQVKPRTVKFWEDKFFISFVSTFNTQNNNITNNITSDASSTTSSSNCAVLMLDSSDEWSFAGCGSSLMPNVTDFHFCGAYTPGCPTGSFLLTDGIQLAFFNARDQSENILELPVEHTRGFKINAVHLAVAMNGASKRAGMISIASIFFIYILFISLCTHI